MMQVLLLRNRVWLWMFAVVAALCLVRDPGWNDWHYLRDGASWLFASGGLHLYAHHAEIQFGPVALATAKAFTFVPHGGKVAAAVVALLAIPVLNRCVRPDSQTDAAVAALAALLWALTAIYGQWADCLAISLLVIPTWGPVAVLVKPWTLPALVTSRRTALFGALLVGICYGPFLLASPSTIAAGQPQLLPDGGSLLSVTGSGAWVRPFQLAVGIALVLAVRRRPTAIPLVVVASRMMFDPSTLFYYTTTLLVAALYSERDRPTGRPPIALYLSSGVVLTSGQSAVDIWPRALLLIAVIIWACNSERFAAVFRRRRLALSVES